MKRNDKVINIAVILSLTVMVIASYILHFHIDTSQLLSIYSGFFTSLLFLIFAYLSIRWAIKKSIELLLKTVIGGMIFRFLVLITLTLIIYQNQFLIHEYFLSAFFLFYIIFLMVEIYAITKILNDK